MSDAGSEAAAPARGIRGLSHIAFVAPSRQLFSRTLLFYNSLGIPTVALNGTGNRPASAAGNASGSSQRMANGNASDPAEDTEAWLHVFCTPPDGEISIRLTLAPHHGEADNSEGFLEKLSEQGRSLDHNNVSKELVTFSFAVSDLGVIQSILRNLDSPNLRVNHNSQEVSEFGFAELYAYDPLGNLLCFVTNSPSPFARPARVSAVLPAPVTIPTTVVHKAQKRRKRIGVLTSGGDSSGMNAAVRAVVRTTLARGCIPYVVFEGWQGLVDGGAKLKRVGWEDVRGIMSLGGTVIGSARCAEFRTREGRLKAAGNMVNAGIDALVVCGGDGSLTGADMLRSEWPSLIEDLLKSGKITEAEAEPVKKALTIVGLVGSIDNDMASTDITIGANTSLHRICESLDSIVSTALSHQRAFVVEVMGRHCGWLALMAAIAVAADWVFLPERPPPLTPAYDDWETEMCESLARARKMGNRKTIVIVSEGAINRELKPITGEQVKQVLEKRLGLDTRVTTLGHVQRGGTPSAFDRYLATVQGVKAVDAVLEATPETPSPMIGMSNNKIIKIPLMEAVKLTHEVADAVAKHDFARAMELRDPDFQAAYDAYIMSSIVSDMVTDGSRDPDRALRVAVMHVGAPAGGMNAATRGFVRVLLNRGHTALGIYNGFSGLAEGNVKVLTWADVNGWTTKGGSELGTNRDQPSPLATAAGMAIKGKGENGVFVDIGLIAYNLQKFNIQAIMIVGGFEALTSVITLHQARTIYPAFCVPIVHLPATVSNNVPGTEYSIGSDTALNAIVQACDTIKLSAAASRKRVFVVEVQGGNCGYLAAMGGLATGATNCYIPEEGVNLDRLQNDVKHLIRRYSEEDELGIPNEGRIIIRNEGVSQRTYSTEVLSSIFHEEGKGLFDSRTATLGHLQQGGVPSPLDRIRAMRMAVSCAEWIEANALASIERRLAELHPATKEGSLSGFTTPTRKPTTPMGTEVTATAMTLQSHQAIAAVAAASAARAASKGNGPSARIQSVYCPQSETAVVIGVKGADVAFTPVETIMAETDLTKRKAIEKPWWLDIQHLTRMLAKYGYVEEEAEDIGTIISEETVGGREVRRLAMLKNMRAA